MGETSSSATAVVVGEFSSTSCGLSCCNTCAKSRVEWLVDWELEWTAERAVERGVEDGLAAPITTGLPRMVEGFLVGSCGNRSAVEDGLAEGRAGNLLARVEVVGFAGVPQGLVFLLVVGMV